MEKTLYLLTEDKDVSPYVIFSGDPRRVEKIIKYMDDVKQIAISREFHTYTGFYKGVKITITSTGIGAPSAAIALEEMYECGMKVAVRLGTTMGLIENLLGKFIIPIGVMREDGTSATYAPLSFPAIADIELLKCMNKSAKDQGFEFDNGLVCSFDGFYSQMRESKLAIKLGINVMSEINNLKKLGIHGIDMESSLILTLARLMDVKACSVTMTTVLENLKESMVKENRKQAEENDLVKLALEGIINYENEYTLIEKTIANKQIDYSEATKYECFK